MDPVTRAMRQLTCDAEAFWRAYPSRLLPIFADEDQRRDVVQAFRLRELAPESRRPLVVIGAPFAGARAYFATLAGEVAHAYELVRKGVAEEGVELPPFVQDEGTPPDGRLERAVLVMDRAARLLGEQFDGIVVALVPDHVTNEAGWRESMCLLAAICLPPRVRLAILAPPGGPLSGILGAEGARFHLDPSALLAFFKERLPEVPPPFGTLHGLLFRAAETPAVGGSTERTR